MGKYIKKFNTHSDYEDFIKTEDFILPNVSLCAQENEVHYNPKKVKLLDYLFSDGTFGADLVSGKTPVGICVAPASHFADGKSRFMSLKEMTTSSTEGITSHEGIVWNTTNTDAGLTKFATVAVVDGEGAIKGVNGYGFIPAKRAAWSGNTQPADRPVDGVYYASGIDTSNPSAYPFLEDGSLNPNYAATTLSGSTIINSLSDVNGVANTTYLVGLGNTYKAANACRSFTPGTHNGEWYLPAMGELGYTIASFDDINAKINDANSAKADSGVQLDGSALYWSSTEYSEDYACILGMDYGLVNRSLGKNFDSYVRAFLAL